tara:strand:- start:67 stop:483 length:417 start_codon:yes stop_codon:yes gene_type:complete
MTNQDNNKLRDLAKQYELTGQHFFKSPLGFIIITRSGIEKISRLANIKLTYVLKTDTPEKTTIKCIAEKDGDMIESYGETDLTNLPEKKMKNGNILPRYPVAMAEKRAKSRAVLMLTEFYEAGAYGEDESEDFKRPKK